MRKEFSEEVAVYLSQNPYAYFLTGDLGFAALEPVREAAGERFINAGVAEQNMVGVAAGIAYTGQEVFVYSIAPFAVYRCLEQIKIDVCVHRLPVYVVGNGGGYGYGIMGATHHAIEDIACLSGLPNMHCWIPAFAEDVKYCLERMTSMKRPGYLRLGAGRSHAYQKPIADINDIRKSDKARLTIVAMGPVVQNVLDAIDGIDVDLFTVLSVPLIEPDDLLESIRKSGRLMIVEEHVQRGGFGEHLVSILLSRNALPPVVKCLYALGYPSGNYGSQKFHQKESGLDAASIRSEIENIIR